jgi:hypothetical protein
MTRQDILNEYKVNAQGIIESPGKFEGEMLYVPFYWNVAMNGFANFDNGKVFGFVIEPEDKVMFPELGETTKLYLEESDQGFVYSGEEYQDLTEEDMLCDECNAGDEWHNVEIGSPND